MKSTANHRMFHAFIKQCSNYMLDSRYSVFARNCDLRNVSSSMPLLTNQSGPGCHLGTISTQCCWHDSRSNFNPRKKSTSFTGTPPKHPELQKLIYEKSFDSLAEAIGFHEMAMNAGMDVKGFFTNDKETLKVAAQILNENPHEQFLADLILTPPSQSTNEQRSRIIRFSAIEHFPQYLLEYKRCKDTTALLSVGGPAALDTAVLASLIEKVELCQNTFISGPFDESNLAHSALQLHVRHGTALNADSHLTGHALLLPFLMRNIWGCSIETALHPDFRKIDLHISSITAEKLRIYIGNEFNWLRQAVRYRLGSMTEHDLNRLESAFSQDVLHLIEDVSGVVLSSNAGRDPKESISIHVDLTEEGSRETSADNRLMKETVGIESERLDDDEKELFFGDKKEHIIQATRYPNDGSLLLQAQCLAKEILTYNCGRCLEQYISHILFAEDESIAGKARLAGVITDSGQFIYASHLHLSPGYKAKFEFGEAKRSSFFRNLANKMKNQLGLSSPVPQHRLTVATGTSVNALIRNSARLKKIIATYGTTPQFAVTNSHWTMLAHNDSYILMRITGGGNTGCEDYNPAYFLNLIANTERIFGHEALAGIISTYGCPRSINSRNSTEFFKAANVLISYGKGGTGNTKRHAEAALGLLELGFNKEVLEFFEHKSSRTSKKMAETIRFIHVTSKRMGFMIERDAHFNRRLGYDGALSIEERFGIAIFLTGALIFFVTATSMLQTLNKVEDETIDKVQ